MCHVPKLGHSIDVGAAMIDENPNITTDVYDEYVWGKHGYRLVVPRDIDLHEKLMQATPDGVGRHSSLKKIVRAIPGGLSRDDRYKKLAQAGYDGLTLCLLKREQRRLPENLRGKAGAKYAAEISQTIKAAEEDMQTSRAFYSAFFTFAALATFVALPFGFILSALAAFTVGGMGMIMSRRAEKSVLRSYKTKMNNLHEAEKQRLVKLMGAAPAEIKARMEQAKNLEQEAERLLQKAKGLRAGTIAPKQATPPTPEQSTAANAVPQAALPIKETLAPVLAPRRSGPTIRIDTGAVPRA